MVNLIFAFISALAAGASAVVAWLAYSKSKSADIASRETLEAMREANRISEESKNLAANEDKRQETKAEAQPWVITRDGGHTFRARNNLSVPLLNVNISPESEDLEILEEETPLKEVKDGESFTFIALQGGEGRRVRITYSLSSEGEEKSFVDPVPLVP